MPYERITIRGLDHDFITDCAVRLGDLAVTRSENGDGWRITYLRTGHCLPAIFPSVSIAEACARKLNDMVDWRRLSEAVASGGRPNEINKILQICREHGGKKRRSRTYYESEQSRMVLRERLDQTEGVR